MKKDSEARKLADMVAEEDYLGLAKSLLDTEASEDDPNAIFYLLLLDIATSLRAIAKDVNNIYFKGS